jgi:hypothetical protein
MRVKSDADALDTTLTKEMIGPLLRMNEFVFRGKGKHARRMRGHMLPFQMRFKSILDTENVLKKLQAAQLTHGMGAQLDEKQILRIGGFKRPESPDEVLGVASQKTAMAMQAEMARAQQGGGEEGEDGGEAPPEESGGGEPNGDEVPVGSAPGPALSGSRAARPDTYERQGEGPTPPRLERSRYARSKPRPWHDREQRAAMIRRALDRRHPETNGSR